MADKKKKIEILSASGFAKSIKNKWLIYGAIAVGSIFALIVLTSSDGKRPERARAAAPKFVDNTPENSNQRQVLSQIQSRLMQIESESAKERETAKSREAKLLKEIEAMKEAQAKDLNKAMTEYKKKIDAELEAKEKANKELAKANDGGILIPTGKESTGGKTPPPPPIYVPDGDKKTTANNRPNLPSSTIQGGTVSRSPMIITGSTDNGDNVISGSSLAEPDKTKKGAGTYLPAGSFAHVALITGADFGAGRQTQSNPQPSLLTFQSDATLPGMAKYKLKDCFAIANGYGELSSERAYLQVSRLSCVQERTGKVLEAGVLGYLADSDGKLGLRGVVQRRSGMLLAKALLAGFADGASKIMSTTAQNAQQAITGSGVVTTIDPSNAGRAAAWAGASSAMEKLAEQYIKDADSVFPVIEVDAGRKATIIFQQGQELTWREPKSEGK